MQSPSNCCPVCRCKRLLTPSLSKDSTVLSKPDGDTPQGVQKRPRSCQGDAETMSSPCTGASLQTAQNPMKQQQGLRQVHLTPWEEGRDGAGQEDSWLIYGNQFSSVQFSRSVVSDSSRPHESQHTKPPCPSPTPGVYPNSCASSR